MGFGAKTETVQRGSQASPFAEDLLAMLQGHLTSDAFGKGVGPLQRQAGDALQRFIDAKTNRPEGILSELAPLFTAATDQANQVAKRGIADTRDRASLAGNSRLGSGAVNLESRLLEDISVGLGSNLAQIAQSARAADEQSILSAIGALQGFGDSNLAPLFQLAAMGILPEEIIQTAGVGSQLFGGLLNAGGNFFGGAGGALVLEELL